jgi:hypothetical protein
VRTRRPGRHIRLDPAIAILRDRDVPRMRAQIRPKIAIAIR